MNENIVDNVKSRATKTGPHAQQGNEKNKNDKRRKEEGVINTRDSPCRWMETVVQKSERTKEGRKERKKERSRRCCFDARLENCGRRSGAALFRAVCGTISPKGKFPNTRAEMGRRDGRGVTEEGTVGVVIEE